MRLLGRIRQRHAPDGHQPPGGVHRRARDDRRASTEIRTDRPVSDELEASRGQSVSGVGSRDEGMQRCVRGAGPRRQGPRQRGVFQSGEELTFTDLI